MKIRGRDKDKGAERRNIEAALDQPRRRDKCAEEPRLNVLSMG